MAPTTDTPPRLAANHAAVTLLERLVPSDLDLRDGDARLRLAVKGGDEVDVVLHELGGRIEEPDGKPDALLRADSETWERVLRDLPSGLSAFGRGQLEIRSNLHVGVNFLASTSGSRDPARLRFETIDTKRGAISTLQAGVGPPVLMLHGLGGTKASFLPTVGALAPEGRRVIAADLPGFGDSDKPIGARYDPKFFAQATLALMDELGIERTDIIGHSLGGRVTLEVLMYAPERFNRAVLMTPSLAWLRERRWASFLKLVRPELGLLQPAPRPVVERIVKEVIPGGDSRYAAAGIDEFLRAYTTPRGRAAFYAAARQIYLEDPQRFWDRLKNLEPPALFIWGGRDPLVPTGFERHVRDAVPQAKHVTLNTGHVPQVERPADLHREIGRFFAS
ncbi:MAG TPA: alpha/beta hydrolase [Thermoleophilaceae bacterium]|nr:alpha/beta hydrolase [Thermoleophilaceae bacterium]